MTIFETARSSTKTGAAEAVDTPRRQVIAIAVLTCVPLPLLSLAATLVPLPQIVERAAATFVSISGPVADPEERLIREKPVAVRSVEITYSPSEQVPVSTVAGQTRRAESRTAAHGAPERRAASTVAVHSETSGSRGTLAKADGSRAMLAQAGREAAAKPTTTSPAKMKNDPRTKGNASTAAKTGRGSARARRPTPPGRGGERGSEGARSGGRTNGGGAVGANPAGSSTEGGTPPPGSGNAQANQTTPNPGAGSGSPPVYPPARHSSPGNGHGKP